MIKPWPDWKKTKHRIFQIIDRKIWNQTIWFQVDFINSAKHKIKIYLGKGEMTHMKSQQTAVFPRKQERILAGNGR